MPVERRGHTTGAFLVPAPQIPALPGVGLHVVILVSAVGTVIVQFDGQGFRVLDVVRLRRGGRRRLLWRPVGDGLRLVAVHPCLDGAVNVRVGEFVEFPCARQVAVFGSRGCCIGRFAVDDAESHLALRAIHIALRDLAETVDGRAERKIRGLRLIIRPHPHTCGTLADGIGRLEVDGHLGLAGMLTGVCARIWHATAHGAVAYVDHGVADLRLVPPVTVRTVRVRAIGEVELRRREIRAFRQIGAVPATCIGGIRDLHGLHRYVLFRAVGLLIVQFRHGGLILLRLVIHGQCLVADQRAVRRITVLRLILTLAGIAFRHSALIQRDRAALADGGFNMSVGYRHRLRTVA